MVARKKVKEDTKAPSASVAETGGFGALRLETVTENPQTEMKVMPPLRLTFIGLAPCALIGAIPFYHIP
jgi:hypothetical protein